MRVISVEAKPFHWLGYNNAAKGGGTVRARLPFFHAKLDALPDGCDAMVFSSDLQGRISPDRPGAPELLLGEGVAAELESLSDARAIADVARSGVVLAGDLYSVPGAGKRGGFGPVNDVYEAFSSVARWVLGVAGNHDDVSRGIPSPSVLLDGDVIAVGGVRFGGVGYVCGDPNKAGKRDEEDQLAMIDLVIGEGVDVLVLHEGPSAPPACTGHDAIRQSVLRARVGLTVFGHRGWQTPHIELAPGVHALNVHERVIVATA